MPQPDRAFDGTALTGTGGPRQRLLDCAAQLFREKGYERTTVTAPAPLRAAPA